MKILHLSDHLPGYHKVWGGAEQGCLRIIELLNSSGKVDNSVMTTPPANPSAGKLKIYAIQTLIDILKFRVAFDPFVYIKALKIFKKVKPDIIHLHRFVFLSLAVMAAAKKRKIPTIVSIYDYWLFCPKDNLIDSKNRNCEKFHGLGCVTCVKTRNPIKMIYLLFRKLIFDRYIRIIDKFLVLSSDSKSLLMRYGIPEKKIEVIHLAFDFDNAEVEGNIAPHSILMVGWVEHRKGQHVILQALPKIAKEFPKVKLRFIGKIVDQDYKRMLDQFIKAHNLSAHVEFLGRVSDEELKKQFSQAHVIVVPEQWQNMSPMIVIEAMSKKKAVVASRIGGIPEFIKEGINGFLAESDKPEEFADSIIRIFQDKSLRQKIRNKARENIIEKCDRKNILRQLMNLYESKI